MEENFLTKIVNRRHAFFHRVDTVGIHSLLTDRIEGLQLVVEHLMRIVGESVEWKKTVKWKFTKIKLNRQSHNLFLGRLRWCNISIIWSTLINVMRTWLMTNELIFIVAMWRRFTIKRLRIVLIFTIFLLSEVAQCSGKRLFNVSRLKIILRLLLYWLMRSNWPYLRVHMSWNQIWWVGRQWWILMNRRWQRARFVLQMNWNDERGEPLKTDNNKI